VIENRPCYEVYIVAQPAKILSPEQPFSYPLFLSFSLNSAPSPLVLLVSSTMGFLDSLRRKREGNPPGLLNQTSPPTPKPFGAESDHEDSKTYDGPLPLLTFRTLLMAICVAMGGFIFGYDTGQISGFLEMRVFLERFGERTTVSDTHPYGYYFSNVRSGLIVALVSLHSIEVYLIGC